MRALAFPKIGWPKLGLAPHAIAFVLVLGLVGAMALEPTRQLLEQRKRISGMAADLDSVQKSNRHLEAQIQRLKSDDYIEQKAREQIGLARPGETVWVVLPPSRDAGSKKKRAARVKAEQSRPVGFVEGLLHFIGL